jgi:hypothetical protein
MGFVNRDELKQSIITWSHRSDLDLLIDDFITLAETAMTANQVEPLKVRSEETRATALFDTTSRFLALPDSFVSMRKLSRIDPSTGARIELQFRTPGQLYATDDKGTPAAFTITSQIEFNVTPLYADSIEMQYLKEFTPLSSANTVNSVLTESPDIYLYGSLWALYRHVDESDESARYYQLFISAIQGANKKAKAGTYGPRPRMIPRGIKP